MKREIYTYLFTPWIYIKNPAIFYLQRVVILYDIDIIIKLIYKIIIKYATEIKTFKVLISMRNYAECINEIFDISGYIYRMSTNDVW